MAVSVAVWITVTVVGMVKLLTMLAMLLGTVDMVAFTDTGMLMVALAIMAGMLVERNPLSIASSL